MSGVAPMSVVAAAVEPEVRKLTRKLAYLGITVCAVHGLGSQCS